MEHINNKGVLSYPLKGLEGHKGKKEEQVVLFKYFIEEISADKKEYPREKRHVIRGIKAFVGEAEKGCEII